MKKLYGITVAMLTPFQQDGRIDLAKMAELTEWLVENQVDCLYPCGTTGLAHMLTNEERMALAETVVKHAKGKVNVFIHTGANRLSDTAALTKHALEIGADGAGIVTPCFFHLTDDELYDYYKAISEAMPKDFPLYLYNIPQLAGNDLTGKTVKRLAQDFENIVGIKYSWPDLDRAQEYTRAREGFSVLMGTDALFSGCMTLGMDGIVTGTAAVYPEVLVALKNALNADKETLRAAEDRALKVTVAMKRGNIPYLSAGLKIRGIGNGLVRAPMRAIEGEAYEALKKELAGF